jgi:hypothetical protein
MQIEATTVDAFLQLDRTQLLYQVAHGAMRPSSVWIRWRKCKQLSDKVVGNP